MGALTRRREWQQNWRVAAGSGLGVATGYSVFPSASSLFVLPLHAAFGWSRGAQSLAQNATIFAALISPLTGMLIDRVGPRRVALTCMPALAACYIGLALMGPSIGVYYLLMALTVLIGTGTTGMVFSRPVVAAFVLSRGLALALSRIGIGLAGTLLPVTIFAAIKLVGWRGGYCVLAAMTLGIGLPAAIAWLPRSTARNTAPAGMRMIRPSGRMLVVVAASALTIGPVVGILSQLQPILIWRGLPPASTAELISLFSLATIAGTLITGALIDRIWAPLVACLILLLPAIGCVLLVLAPSSLTVGSAIVLIGVAQGAEIDLMGFLAARYFGILHFAAIFGFVTFGIGLTSAGSSIAFAYCYDVFRGYGAALLTSAGCFAASALMYLSLGPYPNEESINDLTE